MARTIHLRSAAPGGFPLIRTAAAVAVAALMALLFSVPASAADPVGQITGLGGKCVDVAGASSANGTPVQLYDCNGTGAQQWTVGSDGTLRALGKCLDIVDQGTANGSLVQLWDCTGGQNQKWSVNTAHDIVSQSAGKCLDAKDQSSANGTRLQIWSCTGQSNQKWTAAGTTGSGGGTSSGGFVLSEAQFNQMFPSRNSFYTYQGLVNALGAYPGFTHTGSATTQKQEAAAFLANVAHETGDLQFVVEQNTANYPTYCDRSQSFGCPAGQSAYYGRGPLQLSWNFNYKAAGDALGIDLLDNPNLVQTDAATSWKTALWYWNTQTGAGTMTSHNAIVNGAGFGQTIQTINGSVECHGGNTAEVQDRINHYEQYAGILGVSPGANLSC
jgi:predicted chitinase